MSTVVRPVSRKEYLLINAPMLIVGLTFMILGSCFTIFPTMLDHTAFSFEKRGPIHHMWHYTLLMGGVALVAGVWYRNLNAKVAGLWACAAVLAINLTAAIFEPNSHLSGMDAALRIALLTMIFVRIYVVIFVNHGIVEYDRHAPHEGDGVLASAGPEIKRSADGP